MYLIREIGMDPDELLGYARQAVIFVGTFLIGGTMLGVVIVLLKRLFRSQRVASSAGSTINATSAADDPPSAENPDRSPD